MSKKGINIYKRKDGRWEGRFIKQRLTNGKYKYGYVFADKYGKAKKLLIQQQSKWENDVSEAAANKTKLRVLGEDWLNSSTAFLKESTVAKYRDYFNGYIVGTLGDYSISDITNGDLTEFCHKVMTNGGISGKGLCRTTVLSILGVLNSIKKYAENKGLVVHYVTDCIDFRVNRSDKRVFSSSERLRLIEYLESNMNLQNLGIYTALCTGIRIGELCALRWEDISLVDKKMHIRRTMQRIRCDNNEPTKTKIVITPPKSEYSKRTIPLFTDLCEKMRAFYRPNSYVLTGDNETYIEPRRMQYYFKSILNVCDIKDANFHALRHTFATRSVDNGVDIKCLSEILGHSSVTVTLSNYVHPSMESKRKNMVKAVT